MTLSLRDCTFAGPALPEPFVKFELERQLAKLSPLPKGVGAEGRALQTQWDTFRSKLRALGDSGGDLRVLNHVIEPLAPLLGYGEPRREEKVRTREGDEDAGWWLPGPDQAVGLRAWTVALGIDLDAPNRRGRAYRFSPARVAARVLLAKGERAGLLTDGHEVRLLLCDPARPDSHVAIALDRGAGWRGARNVPDSLRLLVALGRPTGVAALPEIVEAARLSQTTVTRKLREQARNAVRDFVQGVLDEPGNAGKLAAPDLAKTLWEEGLVLVYRLLFILKMESAADPSRAFSFAATSLWRNSYSPNTALAPAVGAALAGVDTGGFLEHSLRTLFRLFSEGMESVELKVSPLGGALFGSRTTPVLDDLAWGERAVAHLLDALLWTPGEKKTERERVHYGSLDVEDLGRVYEALLELEPGITAEPMCRLRRAKLEVVVPAVQGVPYRATAPTNLDADEELEEEEEDDDAPKKGKTKVAWVEDIPAGRFFLRTGLGRKSSGSYYTPHPFVRFLVQETLGPQVAERSPPSDPQPLRILSLKVLDPAMGSGHFLVEACRFLGDSLYEACRLCDERASTAEESGHHALAAELRKRVADLPDPNDELLEWLPSRAPEGTAGGLSQQRAQSLCRRLVAVHCLYGVDRNRLAVELAKLSLWLESYAEGLPLTFMDHRVVCGDSLTGPFLDHVFTWPKAGGPIGEDLLAQGLRERLEGTLTAALDGVRDLTASVGKDVADLVRKAMAKSRLDASLAPFRSLAEAWTGAVMLGDNGDDGAYLRTLTAVAEGREVPDDAAVRRMIEVGSGGVAYDLAFPEVFHPDGRVERTGGFDAVVGNPPWDKVRLERKELIGTLLLPVLDAYRRQDWEAVFDTELKRNPAWRSILGSAEETANRLQLIMRRMYPGASGAAADVDARGDKDLYMLFVERALSVAPTGTQGLVVAGGLLKNPSAAGIRHELVRDGRVRALLHFVNLKRTFADLPPVVEFALVLAGPPVRVGRASLGQELSDWSDVSLERAPVIALSSVHGTGWHLLSAADGTRGSKDGTSLDAWLKESLGRSLTRELDKTGNDEGFVDVSQAPYRVADARVYADAERLRAQGLLALRGSRTFQMFNPIPAGLGGARSPAITLAVRADYEPARRFLRRAQYFRVGIRRHVGSVHTNERTVSAAVFSPGMLANDQLLLEGAPWARSNARMLICASVLSAFAVDSYARRYVGSMMSSKILAEVPAPSVRIAARTFLSHSALRLSCWDSAYQRLWTEELGDAWREPTPQHTWPVLAGDDARWAVRAAIDAVVADAYRLSREQYADVLGSFSHKSYPKAPALCLAAFDELKAVGIEAFAMKYDPYYDIPLNEALPKPVIEFGSIPTAPPAGGLFEEPR
jgi:hypothetical protein